MFCPTTLGFKSNSIAKKCINFMKKMKICLALKKKIVDNKFRKEIKESLIYLP